MPIPSLLEKLIGESHKRGDDHDHNTIDCPACDGRGRIALSGQREMQRGQLVVPEIECTQCIGGKIQRAQCTK